MEELEAVDWYDQRAEATRTRSWPAILVHNRDEEKEHAAMVLEWLRRRDPKLDEHLRTYLFTIGFDPAARGPRPKRPAGPRRATARSASATCGATTPKSCELSGPRPSHFSNGVDDRVGCIAGGPRSRVPRRRPSRPDLVALRRQRPPSRLAGGRGDRSRRGDHRRHLREPRRRGHRTAAELRRTPHRARPRRRGGAARARCPHALDGASRA